MSKKELEELNTKLSTENEQLRAMILHLKREKFGSKTEKFIPLEQQQLFNEIEREAALGKPEEETETIIYTRKKKGKQERKPFPDHLEREEVVIDLNTSEKFCPHDGTALKEIGEVRSEKLKTIPAQTSVVVFIKKKYACPCCDGYIVQAKSNSILPGTIATPELLSFIIFSKFFQSLTLYRLEELFKLQKIELTRATMARWLVNLTEKLMPIRNVLEDKLLSHNYAAIDATRIQVLKEDGRKAETKSAMWVRGSPELGIILFDYNESEGGAVARELMEGFSGALQADAHRGYGAIDKKRVLLLGCLMHSRRRFYKAWIESKKQSKIASKALACFDFLYRKEESYKEANLTPRERHAMRQEEILPSMESMRDCFILELKTVLPSSTIGNALTYFINEYEELTAFLKNGRYEMDNGWVERQIKRFAIGRKNWLFADTVSGANASSLLYSLVLTAKLNGKDPYEAMVSVLNEIPFAKKYSDYEQLTKKYLLSEPNLNSCRKKEGAIIKRKPQRFSGLTPQPTA